MTLRVVGGEAGQPRHTLTGHTNPVAALVVAPDGSWLASAGRDTTVRTWDPHTGQARHTLTGHTEPVTVLAVVPDGAWLASEPPVETGRCGSGTRTPDRPATP